MSSFESSTSVGVDMDWLFPGRVAGPVTTVSGTSSEFVVSYVSDELNRTVYVRFTSFGDDLTYDTDGFPDSGSFDRIDLLDQDGTTSLANFNGDQPGQITDYLSDFLPFELALGDYLYEGNAGADTLRTYGPGILSGVLVGNGGNDRFVLTDLSDVTEVHGSAQDGSGGGAETDLIVSENDLDFSTATATITNIDGFETDEQSFVTFDADGAYLGGAQFILNASQIGGSFNSALVVNGIGATPLSVGIAVVIDSPGGTLDASLWQATNLDDDSELHVTGSSGNDTITGWALNDTIVLGGGADTVSTGAGFDIVFADDTASGGSIDAGTDIDEFVIDWSAASAGLTLNLSTGVGPGGMTLSGFESVTALGSDFSDNISGGSGSDFIEAEDGDDVVGDIDGDPGYFDGGAGTDRLVLDRHTTAANFTFDLLDPAVKFGGAILLADGSIVLGFEQLDFTAGTGNDAVSGGALADVLRGGAGRDALSGRNGSDTLDGGTGIDTLDGGDGNDFLTGGGGSDSIDGGDGFDVARFLTSTSAVGVNRVNSLGGFGDGYGDVYNNVERFELSALNDSFVGTSDNEVVLGGAGNDTLDGGGGDDTLDGGTGTNTLTGGTGNDTYFVRNTATTIVETAGGGTADIVRAAVSFTLAADDDIEKLTTTSSGGTTAINLTGNAFKQEISGNTGANSIDGKGGLDTLTGLGGNDTYFVRDAGTIIVETAGGGTADIVRASVSFTLAADDNIEKMTTTSSSGRTAIDLTGNSLKQEITGNAGANRIDGKGGNDILTGLGGKDVFVFSNTPGNGHADHITDFSVVNDQIELDGAVFTTLGIGPLAASAFRNLALGPKDADDLIIYSEASGRLYYDADGSGTAFGSEFFALIDNKATLTAADFVVI